MAARGPYAAWIRSVQFAAANLMLPIVKEATPSDTLKAFVQAFERFDNITVIGVPHYWAAYFHDGTGAFGPRRRQYLVFWADPLRDDPRVAGRYPIRYSEWRPLTKEEFAFGLEVNRALAGRHQQFNGPWMFVTKYQQPRPGKHWLQGLNPATITGPMIHRRFSDLVRATLGKSYRAKSTAKAELRVKLRAPAP